MLLAAALGVAALACSSGASAVSIQWHTPTSDASFYSAGGSNDLLPSSMAAGHFNSDGLEDLIVCSAGNNSCWMWYGRAFALGPLGAPDVIFVGPGGGFGSSVAFLGDINKDGREDLGVGAPTSVGESGVLGGGSLWVFFGQDYVAPRAVGYFDANTTIFGAAAGDRLGTAAAPAGDLDGDGYGDFWVSAPNASEATTRVGEVLLIRGKASWPTETYRSAASLRLVGEVANGGFGRVLLGRVDLDGDGRLDLATSTPLYRDGSNTSVGAAFAFMGPFPVDGRTTNAATANITFWGDVMAPALGASLAFVVDFTKERGRILVVGSPTFANNTSQGGSLHLFKVLRLACCQTYHRWDEVGLIYTVEQNDQLGTTVAAGGDFDHDGFGDLVVGAPNADVNNITDAGRVFLIYGNETGRDPVLLTPDDEGIESKGNRTLLGQTVIMCDCNGDGWADFVTGAPGDARIDPKGGVTYGFLGRPRNRPPSAIINVSGELVEGSFVDLVANITDLDGDRIQFSWAGIEGGEPYSGIHAVRTRFGDEGLLRVAIVMFDGTLYGFAEVYFEVANANPTCEIKPASPFVEGITGTLVVQIIDAGFNDSLYHAWYGPAGMLSNNLSAVYQPRRGNNFTVSVDVADVDGGFGSCALEMPVQNVPPSVSIAGATILYEGDAALYMAVIEDPGLDDAFYYNWSFPGGTSKNSSVMIRPVHPGRMTIEVIVEDLDGAVVAFALLAEVVGLPPDVDIVIPPGAEEGDTIEFVVRQYSGQDFDPITISWNMCLLGQSDGTTYRIVNAEPGEYCVHVSVFDDDFDSVSFNTTINVTNKAPIEEMQIRPTGAHREGDRITLDAIVGDWETTSPVLISYQWIVDGEIIGRERSASFVGTAGKHKIELLATDASGLVSHIATTITVDNVPPTVRISGRDTLIPNAIGVWTAVAADTSGLPVSLRWDVDGVPVAEGAELQWGSPSMGTHIVRVTATDSAGAVAVATMLVSVSPPPPQNAGIDLRWAAVPLGAAAAFAAGLILGAHVWSRIRQKRRRE